MQIHDPSCPTCRSLKSRASAALKRIDVKPIHFRLADITTDEGQAFQERHRVETITLLLFNGKGRLIQTLSGLRDLEEFELLFSNAFGKPA